MSDPRMKIVLVVPEIPHNTDGIGRTCVALDLELILIKPYRFSIDETAVMRSGTRYWKHVQLSQYDSWESFLGDRRPSRESVYFFEEHGAQSFYTPSYQQDAYLVFGGESKGLPITILDDMDNRIFNLSMRSPLVKSLNLANAATAEVYQAMRNHMGVWMALIFPKAQPPTDQLNSYKD